MSQLRKAAAIVAADQVRQEMRLRLIALDRYLIGILGNEETTQEHKHEMSIAIGEKMEEVTRWMTVLTECRDCLL